MCGCGALRLTVTGAPAQVNACACLNCQRSSGSAFTYTAFFPESAVVSIEGEYWTRNAVGYEARSLGSHFCPVCGTTVFSILESMPAQIGISVGCFADPEFQPPGRVYWTSRKHGWVAFVGVATSDAQ